MALDRVLKQKLDETMTFIVKETKLYVALQQFREKRILKHDVHFTFFL